MAEAGFNWIYPFINNAFDWLVKEPLMKIKTKNPCSMGTAFLKGRNEIIITQLDLNLSKNRGDKCLLDGGTLFVSRDKLPVKACEVIYPAKKQLKIRKTAKQQEIALGQFELGQVIRLVPDKDAGKSALAGCT